MTTRRHVLGAIGGAVLLTACGRQNPAAQQQPTTTAVPDGLIIADTQNGLVTVRGDRRIEHGAGAVGSGDGGRVYAATAADGGTALVAVDPRTGQQVGRAQIAGAWVPRVTDPSGRLAALTPPGPARSGDPTGAPPGRDHTPILIAGLSGEQQRLDLAGNFEPDAVSTDSATLFVLEWLPAQAPDRYRVRMVDLPSGTVQPLFTRDKVPVPEGAEEEMRGQGRQAVLSPDRETLYTLYTHQADHRHTRDLVAGRPGGVHAFVHVLHLTQRWAYCLDLPEPFGHGPAAGHAIALSPEGLRLLVVDITSGRLAEADTESLTVTGVTAVPTGAGTASLGATPSHALLGIGAQVHSIDRASGSAAVAWKADGEVRGLSVDRLATRLAVADPAGVTWVDLRTGKAVGRVPVDGLTALIRAV
jgi:hypothetical protein